MRDTIDFDIHQARLWYVLAAIEEIQAVCDVLDSSTLEHAEARAEQAATVVKLAQVRFGEYQALCYEKHGDVMGKLAKIAAQRIGAQRLKN